MDLKNRAKQLKLDIPAVFIALRKKETPIIAKFFAVITVGYALSPIDFIPDFIPVIGLLDDVILLPVLIAITIKLIPEEIFNQCKVESEGLWNKDGRPKKWYFAIPIIIIWVMLVIFVVKLVIVKIF